MSVRNDAGANITIESSYIAIKVAIERLTASSNTIQEDEMPIDEKTKETLRRVKAEEERLGKEAEKRVVIEKAVNLRLMCDYAVSCSYGDIVLIISMLRDYVQLLDGIRENDPQYLAYYRDKFLSVADRLGDQIGYDYDAAVEKCRTKAKRREESDIGEDAVVLAVKRGAYGKVKRSHEGNQETEEKEKENGNEK